MTEEVKMMNIKEFVELGVLQEINRQFLHPLGLALQVGMNPNGKYKLLGIRDERGDIEGIVFAPGQLKHQRMASVARMRKQKGDARRASLGFITQPVPAE